jgi:hypothetical protein
MALRSLARRIADLNAEIRNLDHALDELVAATSPSLVSSSRSHRKRRTTTRHRRPEHHPADQRGGLRPASAVSPRSRSVPGKPTGCGCNRGGDRQANRALYMITVCWLRYDPRTIAYVQRRITEGDQSRGDPLRQTVHRPRGLPGAESRPRTCPHQPCDPSDSGQQRPGRRSRQSGAPAAPARTNDVDSDKPGRTITGGAEGPRAPRAQTPRNGTASPQYVCRGICGSSSLPVDGRPNDRWRRNRESADARRCCGGYQRANPPPKAQPEPPPLETNRTDPRDQLTRIRASSKLPPPDRHRSTETSGS